MKSLLLIVSWFATLSATANAQTQTWQADHGQQMNRQSHIT